MFWVGLGLIIGGILVFINAHHEASSEGFYTETPFLFMLGIYSWGQGLVIAPFWILAGVASIWLFLPIDLLRLYLLFHVIRSGYEVFYWMDHKKSSDESPPLLGHLSYITTGEHVRLYQFLHLMIVVALLFITLSI